MTCHDAREQLSALLDDALPAPERQALDAHLATCADCRRELDQLRGTVALLGRVPPVHAPAGFVDRVLAAAYRPSWPRRVLDVLFRPLRVKLPLEAAAVLLIGVSALYVYQRTPEVRQLARQDSRESSPSPAVAPPTPAAPPTGGAAGQQPSFRGQPPEAKQVPVEPGAARAGARPIPHAATRPTPPAPTVQRGNVQEAPAAKPETMPAPPVERQTRKEARVEPWSDAGGTRGAPSATGEVVQSAETSPSRDAVGARAATPAPAETAAPSREPPPSPEAVGTRTPAAPAPSQTAPPSAAPAPEGTLSTAKSRAAAGLMRALDASGRLTVPAREPAEAALDALLGRLGATRVARRLEGAQGMVLIDVVVPGARYRELIEGLARIGRWVTEYEAQAVPAEVRVEVALTVEP